MATTIQARLDKKSQAALDRLLLRKGTTASQIVRESLILLDTQEHEEPPPKFIGIGGFDSGLPDLATNKRYLDDLGVKSMGKGWVPPEKRSR
jgi:hypothetical protein